MIARALVGLLAAASLQAAPQTTPPPVTPSSTAQAQAPRVGVDAPALPVTLDDVIRRALENNADVAIARIDTSIAAENILSAKGAYDPRLMPLVSFQRAVNASASALGGAVDGRVKTNQAVVGAEIASRLPWAGGSFSITFTETRNATSNQFAKLNPQFPSTFGFNYTQPLWRDRSTLRGRSRRSARAVTAPRSRRASSSASASRVSRTSSEEWAPGPPPATRRRGRRGQP